MLIKSERIPCLCKVSSNFVVEFNDVLPEPITGTVEDYSSRELNLRAPAFGGGKHAYYNPALISLQRVRLGVYEITELSFFCAGPGWCEIIKNGQYVHKVPSEI